MFELINATDMKEGTMYFLKQFGHIVGKLIFVKYDKTPNGQPFATFTSPYCSGESMLLKPITVHYMLLKTITVYRYVSEEEYVSKIKEKYNAKCLDIVLKRLVDESFSW